MRRKRHIYRITRVPAAAQSDFAIKLFGITQIIETLLLVPRQTPWKSTFGGGAEGDGGMNDIGTGAGGVGGDFTGIL